MTAALVAVLALALGLNHLLVVCSGPHCSARIEWRHAQVDCCEREHSVAAVGECEGGHGAADVAHGSDANPDGGCRVTARHAGCVDAALRLELAPLPQQKPIHGDSFARAWTVAFAVCTEAEPALVAAGPPATGPPRTDDGTARRATTVLLI